MTNQNIKVATVTPQCYLGDALKNAENIVNIINDTKADIILFPEMALTGYSIGDYVFSQELQKNHQQALDLIVSATTNKVVVVGGLLYLNKQILNVAYVISNQHILGVTPKYNFANGQEFNDYRYFTDPLTVESHFVYNEKQINVGKNIYTFNGVKFAVEVCHDLWVENAPNIEYYQNGALMVLNISASPFSVDKDKIRTNLCNEASFRGGAYIYTSSGPSETSSDLVFSGHQIVSVLGKTILNVETMSFDNIVNITNISIDVLKNAQRAVDYEKTIVSKNEKYPFRVNHNQALQIVDVTKAALYKRISHIGTTDVVIGVSGGLDSTLALLFAYDTYKTYGFDLKGIHGITMPGLATTNKTKSIAVRLMEKLGVHTLEMPIEEEVKHHLALIGHDSVTKDVTYENAQARYRTYILMDYANLCKGIVLGTGDMSEIALGWSTFAGDQIAMYGLNSGLPKTCVQAMVNFYANKYPFIKEELEEVLNLPITPELTGHDQLTEDLIGRYDINDFIMYQTIYLGKEHNKIINKLETLFELSKEEATIYLNRFIKRFKQNQFKRIAVCEGVKIFDFSLSPREYRFPGDMK